MSRDTDNAAFVGEVQRGLQELGLYTGRIDQHAGPKTRAGWREIVARVSEKDLPEREPGRGVIRRLRLPEDQYVPEEHPKDLIVLHHTVGGSAKSTFDWWATTPERIGTAYIVDRNGAVHETFPPRCWAYHLGIPGTRGRVDRRSIGIEIASEGGLTESDGKLYAFGVVSERTEYRGEVHQEPGGWRGYHHFAAYTEEAVESVVGLVRSLAEKHEVPREFPSEEFAPLDFRGVAGHAHFRADKSDPHPGFPWDRLREAL